MLSDGVGLLEATDQDHGQPSPRVPNKIFATRWTREALNVCSSKERQ
jgi:hypothetical protein